MAATSTSPMERVKMLNLREEAMLRRHLETISTLEKKQLNSLAKDTINLRMELRAHRFRAMKTTVRTKGALQEFDEKWRKRKAALTRERRLLAAQEEALDEGDTPHKRCPSVYERLYSSAGTEYKYTPPTPNPPQRPPSTLSKPTPSDKPKTPTTSSAPPTSKRLLERRTPETPGPRRSSGVSPEGRGHPPESGDLRSSSRSNMSSSLSQASIASTSGRRKTASLPRPPPAPPAQLPSTAPGGRRSSAAHRRPSTLRRTPQGQQKDYLETLLQSIAGGPSGTRVAGERGGNGPEALLSKLEDMKFNEYTDGTMAMEMRKLKRKSVVHGAIPRSQHPSRLQTHAQSAEKSAPARLHTAPPAVNRRREAAVAAAVAAATSWRPPVVRRAWRGRRGDDSDTGVAQENEGLMRLHREGQRQEYEDVLRRVNTFLGKPTKGCLLPRDRLTREDTLLLNKVRPPRTRLKGAVKLVMFLNKTSTFKTLIGTAANKTPGGATTSNPVPGVPSIPEVN